MPIVLLERTIDWQKRPSLHLIGACTLPAALHLSSFYSSNLIASSRNFLFSLNLKTARELSKLSSSTSREQSCRPNGLSLNEFIDGVLEDVKLSIANTGNESTVPLPEIEESFETRVGPIKLKGKLGADGGQFGNLASIKRTGDSVVAVAGDKISVQLEMGLQQAYVRLPRYWAELGRGIKAKGKIDVKVKNNSVSASITLRQESRRIRASVDHVSVDVLEGFDVCLTGLGVANHIAAKIIQWLAKEFNPDIKRRISEVLTDSLQESLNKIDISQVLTDYILRST
ncbi:hypothetical protein AAG570_011722 [Ranatra chinensis]|uniref:Uncharacterized protein n=1 Tax=Ranatra chinensis TaxID=642074 RepID=A0ABD0YIP5_9HEMI